MRKDEKEVIQYQLDNEKEILKKLKKIYQEALEKVDERIIILQAGEQTQSKIYQIQHQQALKKQLEKILEDMNENQYDTIHEYLVRCYYDGYVGALYSLQAQGVPLMMPINQEMVVKAVLTDSKLSNDLYTALGVDIDRLKKVIASEISRGIAAGLSYKDIARNVDNQSKTGISNAMRIVRTEGHRIQNAAALDCARDAKKRGANVVKRWDATLDGRTRPTHRRLHGQIKEIEEPFEIDGKTAMYPGEFGDPSEDCNCRCKMQERSKWGLGSEETAYLGRTENMTNEQLQPIADKLHISVNELRKYSKQIIPVKADSYEDFMRQYNKIWNYPGSDLQKQVEANRRRKQG